MPPNDFPSQKPLRINRGVGWCHRAYDQGTLLTQLDLAGLLKGCEAVVRDFANEWQKTTGELLPGCVNILLVVLLQRSNITPLV